MVYLLIAGFVAFMLPILIVPKCFLALGIFAAFMKSFGIPLTPLVLGGIFYEIITALDPILLTLLGVWTIWKVFIMRKPLVDINYWKHRMSARCCYSRRSNWLPVSWCTSGQLLHFRSGCSWRSNWSKSWKNIFEKISPNIEIYCLNV